MYRKFYKKQKKIKKNDEIKQRQVIGTLRDKHTTQKQASSLEKLISPPSYNLVKDFDVVERESRKLLTKLGPFPLQAHNVLPYESNLGSTSN
jgi:hypothetical protein